jgi:hypothetical protein
LRNRRIAVQRRSWKGQARMRMLLLKMQVSTATQLMYPVAQFIRCDVDGQGAEADMEVGVGLDGEEVTADFVGINDDDADDDDDDDVDAAGEDDEAAHEVIFWTLILPTAF